MEKEMKFCQSCGMPYCIFCYKDGEFLQDVTMEGMIDHCVKYLDEMNQMMPKPMTEAEYRQMALAFFPTLKRWKR